MTLRMVKRPRVIPSFCAGILCYFLRSHVTAYGNNWLACAVGPGALEGYGGSPRDDGAEQRIKAHEGGLEVHLRRQQYRIEGEVDVDAKW